MFREIYCEITPMVLSHFSTRAGQSVVGHFVCRSPKAIRINTGAVAWEQLVSVEFLTIAKKLRACPSGAPISSDLLALLAFIARSPVTGVGLR